MNAEYRRVLLEHRNREVSEKRNYFMKCNIFSAWLPDEVDRLCSVVQLRQYSADESAQPSATAGC